MDLSAHLSAEEAKVGQIIGVSPWVLIDQAKIDAFAHVTDDHQFIHTDPKAAAMGPFGGTIAHGFLTLSLAAKMAAETLQLLPGQRMFINYGFEKVRFLAPVRVGARVRGRFILAAVAQRAPGQLLHSFDLTIEIEGEDKPAVAAHWHSLSIFA